MPQCSHCGEEGHDLPRCGARNRSRSARQRQVRARTVNVHRITQREREALRAEEPNIGHRRPQTRAECELGPRPCPFVGCRYHLYLDVNHNGNIKLNFPDLEVWEMGASCALDLADRGAQTNEAIAPAMNLTRERVRQLEHIAVATLKQRLVEHDEAFAIREPSCELPKRERVNRLPTMPKAQPSASLAHP